MLRFFPRFLCQAFFCTQCLFIENISRAFMLNSSVYYYCYDLFFTYLVFRLKIDRTKSILAYLNPLLQFFCILSCLKRVGFDRDISISAPLSRRKEVDCRLPHWKNGALGTAVPWSARRRFSVSCLRHGHTGDRIATVFSTVTRFNATTSDTFSRKRGRLLQTFACRETDTRVYKQTASEARLSVDVLRWTSSSTKHLRQLAFAS